MTRTSQALKRLGVAAIAVATIGAGVPALIATGASASNSTNSGVTITPTTEAGQINVCNPFTVQVNPADTTTVDIQLSQTVATGTATIGFCDPTASNEGPAPQAAPNGGNTTTTDLAQFVQPTPGTTCQPPTTGLTTKCDGEFTTDKRGRLTVGVRSDTAGTLNITAFVEANNAATFPAYNSTGNNVPDGTEKQAAATKYLVTNAQLAATSIDCTPTGQSVATVDPAQFTCVVYSTQGSNTKVPTRGVTVSNVISAGPDVSPAAGNDSRITCGQPDASSTATPQPLIGATTTNNQGSITCQFSSGGVPGQDTFVSWVEQNGTVGPQSNEPNNTHTVVFVGQARYITCAPKTVDAVYGQDATVTCKVTDVNGNPVVGQPVDYTATFPGGRFANGTHPGTFASTVKTDANGVASIKINNPDQTTTQSQTVTATIPNSATSECNQTAGNTNSGVTKTATTPTAGNCTDTVTVKYTTATSSPSSSSSSSPSGTRSTLKLTVNTPTIDAGTLGTLTVSGAQANSVIQLECYTRPSVTYQASHRTVVNAAGDDVVYKLALGKNTRCYAEYVTNPGSGFSNQGVISVRTVISIFPVRKGVRNYVFQGHNLPKYAGQLITLYYQNNGGEVRRANVKTNDSGIYYIPVHFVGTGTLTFFVRTGQTLTNVAGESAHVPVTIH